MNRLAVDKQVQVIAALVGGNSIRATVHMTRAAKNTVVKLIAEMGQACSKYQNEVLRSLSCQRLQCDQFCYAKDENSLGSKKAKFGFGDVWTWTAICADTKLVPSWMIGTRGAETANAFMQDLASRLAHSIQLTTDGHRAYLDAAKTTFGAEIDYAMLVKLYGNDSVSKTRYSPAECIVRSTVAISGNSDAKHVSSYAERQNLTTRMDIRPFPRLTNTFSKKIENHEAAIALHFMHYNFCRIHQILRVTPAMKTGIADHIWTVRELVSLLYEQSSERAKDTKSAKTKPLSERPEKDQHT